MTTERRPPTSEPWEEQLRQGLDALADLGDEQPPNVADLQMLVMQVQADQRRQTIRDLSLFWLCALMVLGALYVVITRQPTYFLVLQAAAIGAMVVAILVHLGAGKRVTSSE